jgi:ketosteroid isomerase-like protein
MTTADEVSPIAVCIGYLAAFSTGSADSVASFVSDDFVNEHTAALGEGCVGAEEYRRRLPAFLSAMPGLRYEVEDVVADGDRVYAAYTLHTTANDRPIAVRGVMRLVVRDGRIIHRVDYWDSLVYQRQAGVT